MYPCAADQVCFIANRWSLEAGKSVGSGRRENGHTEGMSFLRYAFLRPTDRSAGADFWGRAQL
ncbi:hypothetical protein B5E56_02700 [Flavonifractor sp. An112]|nr:hypothetical protein B5E56_02700 [Flavonifractor sp. An112]